MDTEHATTPRPGPFRQPAGRDRGATFIELLVSIVILGSAGLAVLTALGAAATGAAVNRELAAAQSALATAGDALAAVDVDSDTYRACDTNTEAEIVAAYEAVVDDAVDGVDVADVAYWDGAAWQTDRSACVAAYTVDGERLQRVRLVTTADASARTLEVVKRPATEPTVGVGPLSPSPGGGSGDVIPTPTPGL